MAPFTVVKFSSEDCGTCHRMGHYDAKVAEELGLAFVSVMLQDTDTYRRYRRVLLAQFPTKEGMGWPTYLLVTAPEEPDFVIHGELKGGWPRAISASGCSPWCPRSRRSWHPMPFQEWPGPGGAWGR
jgi:hypothetical protein